jgi:hypothetical protein
MCNNKQLPPAGYAEKVMQNLHAIDNPNVNVSSDADVDTAALHDLPLDGDFLTREGQEVRRLGSMINQQNIPGVFIDRGTRNLVSFGYEEIFSYMPRRADRVSRPPTMARDREMMRRWLDRVQKTRDLNDEVGNEDLFPLLQNQFPTVVRDHLPERLDMNSWIGDIAREKLETEESGTIFPGMLGMWEPWMGTATSVRQSKPGYPKNFIPFLGTGGNGSLVWIYNTYGVPTGKGPVEDARHRAIEKLITGTEENLVRPSIQIANWLGSFIVARFARGPPIVRLTDANIVEAVVEILGDEWFELPFDTEGKLKEWKFQRTLCLQQEQ